MAMVRSFNRLALLVPTEILEEKTPQARSKVIATFIQVRCSSISIPSPSFLSSISKHLSSLWIWVTSPPPNMYIHVDLTSSHQQLHLAGQHSTGLLAAILTESPLIVQLAHMEPFMSVCATGLRPSVWISSWAGDSALPIFSVTSLVAFGDQHSARMWNTNWKCWEES